MIADFVWFFCIELSAFFLFLVRISWSSHKVALRLHHHLREFGKNSHMFVVSLLLLPFASFLVASLSLSFSLSLSLSLFYNGVSAALSTVSFPGRLDECPLDAIGWPHRRLTFDNCSWLHSEFATWKMKPRIEGNKTTEKYKTRRPR